jgi:amino acid adenylation domain-containing protein
MSSSLVAYLDASAAQWPARTAVVDPAGWSLTYRELHQRADAVAAFLIGAGVTKGDRVGVVLPKSADGVACLFGIMKAGAAYVPVDYTAPAERGRGILSDCQVRALVVHVKCLAVAPDPSTLAAVIVIGGTPPDAGALRCVPYAEVIAGPGAAAAPRLELDDLAYILYTSGSTGIPKGVMLTHRNAVSFVDWCSSVFHPEHADRFSSHAPFHFDLSVFDIYVCLKHGAALYIVSEELGKNPRELAQFVAANRLTFWYSTPSILTLLVQFGSLPLHDYSSLRVVLFAGEVFPVKHLRAIKQAWIGPAFFNLYGPTETNVCTFARIPETVPAERDTPYPIGLACSHCEGLVLDDELKAVAPGDEGLLYISGDSVFRGYWNRPKENGACFLERDGVRWYNTGDLVRWNDQEGYLYAGRKDRMIKRRGYRIELGEIERALYKHPRIREAAAIAVPDQDAGVKVVAFLACHGGPPPTIIELKTFCAGHLPSYMSPDRFVLQDQLPKTSTDKIDYQSLRKSLEPPPAANVA